ncbi:MAG: small subunit ribosomal protein S3 [Candidatus Berkelbacteria bacterium Licking1014_7]|uniref:Small ribosomal subunit protein uS3 n=1 Tax=Candidatus Berkelbacteria bacterium Licking1014_7 TaxID=2017147 RepID=A0A554LKJ9_9BACT|nr:MAG: small subunit ribosomal protein S3 [Candidatus Berkelbacteria bacterium Licking1014_7]
MGQKVNPISIRLPLNKNWRSIWYAKGKVYTEFLIQDAKIRKAIAEKVGPSAGIDKIIIKRSADEIKVQIHTSKPGLLIGRQGQGINDVKSFILKKVFKNQKTNLHLEIMEYKKPELSATIVAENIGYQISKRMHYKRAIKQAIAKTKDAGAKGIKVQVSGRLAGKEIARSEKYQQGQIPTSTFRANIDFSVYHAQTTYGTIGIKVWIYK